jgi:hypothetical protein
MKIPFDARHWPDWVIVAIAAMMAALVGYAIWCDILAPNQDWDIITDGQSYSFVEPGEAGALGAPGDFSPRDKYPTYQEAVAARDAAKADFEELEKVLDSGPKWHKVPNK